MLTMSLLCMSSLGLQHASGQVRECVRESMSRRASAAAGRAQVDGDSDGAPAAPLTKYTTAASVHQEACTSLLRTFSCCACASMLSIYTHL